MTIDPLMRAASLLEDARLLLRRSEKRLSAHKAERPANGGVHAGAGIAPRRPVLPALGLHPKNEAVLGPTSL